MDFKGRRWKAEIREQGANVKKWVNGPDLTENTPAGVLGSIRPQLQGSG